MMLIKIFLEAPVRPEINISMGKKRNFLLILKPREKLQINNNKKYGRQKLNQLGMIPYWYNKTGSSNAHVFANIIRAYLAFSGVLTSINTSQDTRMLPF